MKLKVKQIARFEDELKVFNKKAMPFAVRATLNRVAFDTMKKAKKIVAARMTLRNRWTVGSIQVEKAKSLDMNIMKSRVGSREKYMETQERGGFKTSKGKHGVPIATSFASGEGDNAQPRKRLPRKANRVASIQLSTRRARGTRKSRNFAAVKQAISSGRRHIFMDLGKTKGLFKVVGGKKNPQVKMVQSLSNRSVRIPKLEWLQPSITNKVRTIGFYHDELKTQINRNRIFRTKRGR